ncbi:solute carrier family 2, facilitated glucose transporter member 8 [Rhipicephalus microplus]|uniref:solute carrier family 2, facilitated glucose transporter member 8 n=1 Tax=Rhipicephalus microplus TaxID=6941 RepID=UPI003F6BFA16
MRWSPSRSRAEPHVPSVQESKVTVDAKRLATIAAPWAGSLSVGATVGYSLPAARSLISTRDNASDDFRISDKEIFWFDSILLLGAVFGSLCGCFAVQWLGRRRMMALGCLGSLASWLAVAAASADSFHLLTARVLGGLCMGIVSLVVPAYIAEVSPASDRGKTCGAYQLGVAAGVLLMYCLGKFADWTQLALWCAIPPVTTLLLLGMAVESPRWLLETEQHEEAHKALIILRGKAHDADAEYQEIEAIYTKTPTPLIHYMLAVLVIVVQQFSGVNTVLLYASSPLHAGFGYDSDDTLLLLASLQFAMTAITAQLLDAVGRVKPLAVSVVISTSSMVALGDVYFSVSHYEQAMDTHLAARLTVVCKVIFSIGFPLGLGPASWTLAVELAPLRKNGFEFGSVCTFHWASALGIISLFTILGTNTGSLALLVVLSGLVTFTGGMTAFKLLPDTRGISLEGILLQGQGDVRSRGPSNVLYTLKPADAMLQSPKKHHEDPTTTRGEQKKRPKRKDSAPLSPSGVAANGSPKPKVKAQAKHQAKHQAKAEFNDEAKAGPHAQASVESGATEVVASGEDVLSGATSSIASPTEGAPESRS